jgi:hypothetical protein
MGCEIFDLIANNARRKISANRSCRIADDFCEDARWPGLLVPCCRQSPSHGLQANHERVMGQTLDFMLSERRDTAAVRRFFKRAIGTNGVPDRSAIDKSGANLAGLQNLNVILKFTGAGLPFCGSNIGWDRNGAYDPKGPARPNRNFTLQTDLGPRSIVSSAEGRHLRS